MASCTNCRSLIPESAEFCTACGTKISIESPANSTALQEPSNLSPVAPQILYHIANATGQSMGPFNEDVIRSLIVQQRVTIKDSVRPAGGSNWIPITQSKFAHLVAGQATLNRLGASTCPACGAGLVVQIKRPGLGLVLIIIGVCLTPLFGIGIPIWIVGVIIRFGGKGKAVYRCARCNYSS